MERLLVGRAVESVERDGANHLSAFIKRLDELHTREEAEAATLQIPMERRIFPEGRDGRGDEEMRNSGGRPYDDLR